MDITKKIFITPRAKARAKRLNIPVEQLTGSGPNGRIIEQDVIFYESDMELNQFKNTKKVNISPLAKKIVEMENIELKNINGTGVNGKIISKDVLEVLNPEKKKGKKKVAFSGIRKLIATRMVESKTNAPHVTLTVKTEATNLVNYRESLMKQFDGNFKISYTELLIKIVSESLRQHPSVNVSLEKEEIIYNDDINIGVAVALEDGLVSPIIHNADQKSVKQIAYELKDKVSRARKGKLKPKDLENGRFTISNLGMYEVDAFTPVINQPESAILGVGRIIEDIIVRNEQIRLGKTMVLSLSFDHRVMDGAPAATFLGHIKYLIENPDSINNLL